MNRYLFTTIISFIFIISCNKKEEPIIYELFGQQIDTLIIGEPFIWDINTGVEYERYWVDLALILYQFCSKTKNRESILKIQQFIKTNKLK